MPEKSKILKLSDILSQFDESQDTTKTAAAAATDPNVVTPDQVADILGQQQQQMSPDDAAAAAAAQAQQMSPEEMAAAQQQQEEQVKDAIADAARGVVAAQQQYDASVEALKSIAKQAQEKEEASVTKEASEFGKLFANGFMEALEEKQTREAIIKEAYDLTRSALNSEEVHGDPEIDADEYVKIAHAAYDATLEKLAGERSEDEINASLIDVARESYMLTKNALASVRE